jgi:phage-related protein
MYYLDTDAVVVLHIFAKKTQQTPQEVIELCQTRLRRYQEVRERARRLIKKG